MIAGCAVSRDLQNGFADPDPGACRKVVDGTSSDGDVLAYLAGLQIKGFQRGLTDEQDLSSVPAESDIALEPPARDRGKLRHLPHRVPVLDLEEQPHDPSQHLPAPAPV